MFFLEGLPIPLLCSDSIRADYQYLNLLVGSRPESIIEFNPDNEICIDVLFLEFCVANLCCFDLNEFLRAIFRFYD